MTSSPVIDPTLVALSEAAQQQAGGNFDGRCIPMTEPPSASALSDVGAAAARREPECEPECEPETFLDLSLLQLKDACKSRSLKLSGRKAELVRRLQEYGENQGTSPSSLPLAALVTSSNAPRGRRDPINANNIVSTQQLESEFNGAQPASPIDAQKVIEEAAAIEGFFRHGLEQVDDDEDAESGEEGDEGVVLNAEDLDDEIGTLDNPRTHDSLHWADKFILDTRRKGGRETEMSVLKLWKTWTASALNSGIIPDIIVDANHVVVYMKYAATRQLFNTRSESIDSESRLSAASLKKIMTMLGRVRRRQEDENPAICEDRPYSNSRTKDFYKAVMVQSQRLRISSEDFDVTKGTILDSELRPDQFDEVTASIFEHSKHLPTIIKSHFAWTWQCATLNRSDEVVSLPLFCLQPYYLRLPDYNIQQGNHGGQLFPSHRRQFGVLSMYHETKTAQPGKTEPKYSFALPHRNPLRCPIGALAIHLHFMFDQENLISRIPSWNWENAATWRLVHVLFGKKVEDTLTGAGLGRVYSHFLDHTSITSKKKTHLARRTMPGVLEEMGVPADQVDATGHWQGNTRRDVYGSKIPKMATVALAGFPVGETYYVPWAQVEVPTVLQREIFPFCEDVTARLRAVGCTNQGTFNFLELLQALRPFFWRAIGAINEHFPQSPVAKRLRVLSQSAAAVSFLSQWPQLRREEEERNQEMATLGQAFQEMPTQNAFATLSAQVRSIQSELVVIKRRTEPFSPSNARLLPSTSRAHPQTLGASAVEFQAMPMTSGGAPMPSLWAPNVSNSGQPPATPPRRVPTPVMPGIVIPPNSLASPARVAAPPEVYLGAPALNVLIPVRIKGPRNIIYNVLRLASPVSPGQAQSAPGSHTPYDKILPHRSAFPHQMYPQFTHVNCTWQYTFQTVSEEVVLWDVYTPGNLGDYSTVTALWEAWDEGTYIINVGRKAPLRLIEQRWGSLKNEETNQGQLPSWRPRNDKMARKIWSNFFFFIRRIQELIKAGQSSVGAVAYFEDLRRNGNKSLGKLRLSLQEKREAKRALEPDN